MYATISFVSLYNDVRVVQTLPWSLANQQYAEQNAINGRVSISTGELPATKSEKLELLLTQLSETDYMAIKYAEGQMTATEYAPMKLQRQEWRNEYNFLQGDDSVNE